MFLFSDDHLQPPVWSTGSVHPRLPVPKLHILIHYSSAANCPPMAEDKLTIATRSPSRPI